jgi:hypothetical protein
MACSVLVIGDGLYLSEIVGAAMKKQVINRIVNYCFNILCASITSLQARKKKKQVINSDNCHQIY